MEKKYKRRRVYSVIKQPVIVTKEPCENPVQILDTIFHFENRIWTDFIDRAVYQKIKISAPYEEDIRNIIAGVNNKNIRKQIISSLMKIEDYNPFSDELPIEKLPVNLQHIIMPIQAELKRKMRIAQEIKGERKYIKYQNKIYSVFITRKTKENYNKELFYLNNDILILYEDGKLLIASNPDYQYRPDFLLVYNRLNEIEPGIWYLNKNRGMVMTQKDKTTSLQANDIIKIFNQFFIKRGE
jgi:hypothetical protein